MDRRRPAPLRAHWRDLPHPSRWRPAGDDDPVLAAHRAAQRRGAAGYVDPATGLFVMTATALARRGWCCEQGCRHCPYVGAEDDGAPGGTVQPTA